MSDIYSKGHIAKNMIWRFGERIIAQLVTFAVSVVLARRLSAAAFGDVALLMIFIDIANVFVSHGFSAALVQKKDADNIDFSSVLYFSILAAAILYLFAFFLAPLLKYIGDDNLPNLFRVLALRLPLAAVNSVQHAYVQKKMIFRKFFFSTLFGTVISAFVGIGMAYSDFGAWAIVCQYLTNSLCDTIVLGLTIKWKPLITIDFQRLKHLIGFGWKMLCSQLVHVIYQRLGTFFIGTIYSTKDIAFYEQGQKIPGIIETNVGDTINSVLFPAMSSAQDDPKLLKNMIRRSVKTSSFIIWPMMIGLAVLADQLISLIFTDKWLPASVFMGIACLKLGFEPIQTANLQAIKAVGRSDLYLKMEIVKKTYGCAAIIISAHISVLAIAIAGMTQALFSAIVNGFVNYRLFHYTATEQIWDFFGSFLLSTAMGAAVLLLKHQLPNSVLGLAFEIIFGAVIYVGLALVFSREQLKYFLSIVRFIVPSKTAKQ